MAADCRTLRAPRAPPPSGFNWLVPSVESQEERQFAEHTASQYAPRRPRISPRGAGAPLQKRQRRGSWGSTSARRVTNVLRRSSDHDGANNLSPSHSAGPPTCHHVQPVGSTDAAALMDISLRWHPSLDYWLLTATAPRAPRRLGAARIDGPGTPRSTDGGGGGRVGTRPHAGAQRCDDDSDISVYHPSENESGCIVECFAVSGRARRTTIYLSGCGRVGRGRGSTSDFPSAPIKSSRHTG